MVIGYAFNNEGECAYCNLTCTLYLDKPVLIFEQDVIIASYIYWFHYCCTDFVATINRMREMIMKSAKYVTNVVPISNTAMIHVMFVIHLHAQMQ